MTNSAEKSRGKFVVVHGIDGVGKTTLVAETVRRILLSKVPVLNYDDYGALTENPIRPIKSIVKTLQPYEQLLWFLASTAYHSEQIRQNLDAGKVVVKARYVLDVAAHHAHLGVANIPTIIQALPFVQPDLLVLLTLDEQIRQERIASRSSQTNDDTIAKSGTSRAAFFEQYLLEMAEQLHPKSRVLSLESSVLTPSLLAQRVVDSLLGIS